MENTAMELVKELRTRTGAGFVECKKVLEETGMDMDKAIQQLKERGIIKAASKGGRNTKEGVVSIASHQRDYIMLELNCETDFVAKNDMFQKASQQLTQDLLQSSAQSIDTIPSTIHEELQKLIIRMGENIQITRFIKASASERSYIYPYLHQGATIGVLLELEYTNPKTAENEVFQSVAKDLAMHIAAMAPAVISEQDYDSDVLKQEKELFKKQLEQSGEAHRIAERNTKKSNSDPQAQMQEIIERVLTGKMAQFLKEKVLLQQSFIKQDKASVKDWLHTMEKQCGDVLTVKRFVRYKVGEAVQ